MKRTYSFIASLFIITSLAKAQDFMPPVIPWSGESEKLIVDDSHPWVTQFELSDGMESPTFEESMAWFQKLADASPLIEMTDPAKSEQGRIIHLLILSADGTFTAPELKESEKPLIFIESGIHPGEIDGKDAGMMLLRDIAFGEKRELLDMANILYIPILSPDGHERRSEYSRVNQRGPKEMGWRSDSRNLNLNRDFAKLETSGVRLVAKIMEDYDPDLFIDVHVTDGADYQYDVTYGYVANAGYSPEVSKWLTEYYQPEVDQGLSDQGHIPGPLLFAANGRDFSRGNVAFAFSPRFSHTYGDIRHMASILVENHSLKPFKQRVLGTYVLLEESIRTLGRNFEALQKAVESDRNQPKESIVVKYAFNDAATDSLTLLGIKSEIVKSEITGAEYVSWLGEPMTQKIPYIQMNKPVASVPVPKAYWISAEWKEIIEKIDQHGIEYEVLEEPKDIKLEYSKLTEFTMNSSPYEGRMRVQSFEQEKEYRTPTLPAGSIRIPTSQDLGELVVILMEPESVDSFFQWGYFNSILTQTEYIEAYVMEPMIADMLEKDGELKAEFEEKMASDEQFANSPRAIYRWFYAKTPYFDENWKVVPVGREWF